MRVNIDCTLILLLLSGMLALLKIGGPIPIPVDMGARTHMDTAARIGRYHNHPDNRLDYRRHEKFGD
jgi:hypothetical protein